MYCVHGSRLVLVDFIIFIMKTSYECGGVCLRAPKITSNQKHSVNANLHQASSLSGQHLLTKTKALWFVYIHVLFKHALSSLK